jgi:hypothetical protein
MIGIGSGTFRKETLAMGLKSRNFQTENTSLTRQEGEGSAEQQLLKMQDGE